jgi:hypothetical protein
MYLNSSESNESIDFTSFRPLLYFTRPRDSSNDYGNSHQETTDAQLNGTGNNNYIDNRPFFTVFQYIIYFQN